MKGNYWQCRQREDKSGALLFKWDKFNWKDLDFNVIQKAKIHDYAKIGGEISSIYA